MFNTKEIQTVLPLIKQINSHVFTNTYFCKFHILSDLTEELQVQALRS